MLKDVPQPVAIYLLALIRVASAVAVLPLSGLRLPRTVRVMLAAALTLGLQPGIAPPAHLPTNLLGTMIALASEVMLGIAMGISISLVFAAAHWAGELIGQQMGLNLGEVLEGGSGGPPSTTPIGQLYSLFAMIVFFAVNGHHAMVHALQTSFSSMPLMSVGATSSMLDLMSGLLSSATALALRLAAPVFVTMLVVDLVLGMLSRTLPQLNVLSIGTSVRAIVGLGVLVAGFALTTGVLKSAVADSFNVVEAAWSHVAAP